MKKVGSLHFKHLGLQSGWSWALKDWEAGCLQTGNHQKHQGNLATERASRREQTSRWFGRAQGIPVSLSFPHNSHGQFVYGQRVSKSDKNQFFFSDFSASRLLAPLEYL